MTSTRETLVNVFARHSCEEIETTPEILIDAFGVTDFAAVKASDGYDEEYNYASTAKIRIEYIEERFRSQADQQALQCLNTLKHLREESVFKTKQYDVARDIMLRTLYLDWTKADQVIFDGRLAVLDSWTDFFISYTNRNAQTTNDYHRQLISQELGWPSRDKREKANYVARVLVKYLEHHNIHGFRDFKSLESGDDIEAKILEHCRKTIAFVQLVEAKSLEEPEPPTVNWCLQEYEAFKNATLPCKPPNASGNRLFFVVAGDKAVPQPARIGAGYTSWHRDMTRLLDVIVADYAKPFGDLSSRLGKIATQIVETRKRIVESMLASWP